MSDFSTGAATYTSSIDGVAAKVMALGSAYNEQYGKQAGLYIRCYRRREYVASWGHGAGVCTYYVDGESLPRNVVGEGATMHSALNDLLRKLEAALEDDA